MAVVAQLVRALDCGSKCRGFKSRRSPIFLKGMLLTLLQAIILGIVQGFTEFLPISSSAHLYFVEQFLHLEKTTDLLYFDLICHSGTLLALILYLRRDIFSVLHNPKAIALFAIALAPLVPAYFLLKPLIKIASNPSYLGNCLIFTALLLFCASKRKKEVQFADNSSSKYKDVLCIGFMQTMALLPGISRSGSTIAIARILGWSWSSAARFSFLLAIPAILGGQILETWKWLEVRTESAASITMMSYLAGFVASFVIGCFSVRCIFWIYRKGTVRPFAWYCLGIGIFFMWLQHG